LCTMAGSRIAPATVSFSQASGVLGKSEYLCFCTNIINEDKTLCQQEQGKNGGVSAFVRDKKQERRFIRRKTAAHIL
ncbi:MAG: hypothetical protein IKE49_00225, partial [Firmicutes bacterium]|nr:hypothetical protein [Bacillota bacterium]